MKKSVIITGGLGFIGSYVTQTCLNLGWYVKVIDKLTYASNPELLDKFNNYPNFSFEQKDINDITYLPECDYILHLAAESHVDNSISDSNSFVHTNINGTYKILELIKTKSSHNRPILLYMSTDEVYGDIDKGSHNEQDILKPSNPYSATKAAGDLMVQAWGRTYGINYVIVRPTNNYGLGQHPEKLIPKTCKYIELGKKIPLHDKGTPIRNWLHARDTANALITIIESGVKNETYNICGGFELTNIDVVKKILAIKGITNIKPHIDFSCKRPGQDIRYALDDSKLQKLGWKPEANFDDELKEIILNNTFKW